MEELAIDWLDSYRKDYIDAIGQFTNFLLKSCGCEVPIERHDLEEFESAAETIAQIQDFAKDHTVMEYCLISRKPDFKRFRANLDEFIEKVTQHSAADILFEDEDFFDNLTIWISAMSSSYLRSFRHTSTVTLLSLTTELLVLHTESNRIIQQQSKLVESSNKKKLSKTVIANANKIIKEEQEKNLKLEKMIGETFTTIFANRYKDIDPRIRTDCIKYLGQWMEIAPEKFLETQYLRYYGWLLSDESSTTRHQVVSVLHKLYERSDYQTALRQFTERFLDRLVEMATLDVDQSVRSTTVSLLVTIGTMGYSDDENGNKISSLIFDLEPRVRKSAAQFFISQVLQLQEELFEGINSTKLSKLKSKFNNLDQRWLMLKLIASNLLLLTNSIQSESSNIGLSSVKLKDRLPRLVIAGEAIFFAIKKLKIDIEWETLVELLLFDFSSLNISGAAEKQYISNFNLESDEELILLDILRGFLSAKLAATGDIKFGHKRKIPSHEDSETVLSQLIDRLPSLIDKFLYSPNLTSKILALIHLIDLDSVKHIRLESEFGKIFSNVVKQFREQSLDILLEECRQIFVMVSQNEEIASVSLPQLEDTAEDVYVNVQKLLSTGSSLIADDCINLLKKIQYLGSAISVDNYLSKVIHDGQSLADILIDALSSDEQDTSPNMEFSNAAVNLLRLYCVWKLGKLSMQQNFTPLKDQDSDTLTRIIRVFSRTFDHTDSVSQELDAIYKTSLLEVLVVVKITCRQPHLSSKDIDILSKVPDNISDSIQRDILRIFLQRERKYATVADIDLLHSKIDTEILDNESGDDDFHDINNENKNDDVKLLHVDFELCEFAAKLNVAALAGIINSKYAERLKLNIRMLSIGYIELFKEHVNPLISVNDDNSPSEDEIMLNM